MPRMRNSYNFWDYVMVCMLLYIYRQSYAQIGRLTYLHTRFYNTHGVLQIRRC